MARPTVSANLNYSFGPFTESLVPVQPAPRPSASVATVATAHLAADLDYLQHPDTARSPHTTTLIATHTRRHPLGFLASSGPIGTSMATEAVRQDLLEMLQVMNHEMGHSEKIAQDIAALHRQPTDYIVAAVPHILKTIYREMVQQTATQLQHMDTEIQKGLWGSSAVSETMMHAQFRRAIPELNRAVDLIDQGNLQDAISLYSTTMSNTASQVRVFQNAHAESEREKFAAQIGITVLAGAAAAYTGGLSMALMTGGEALAGGAGIGLGTYAVSTGISGSTFALSDRLLQKQIFGTPLLRKESVLENTLDWGGEIVTTGALFGWMQGVGAATRALPAFTGELAPALNAFKNFGVEYAGLTAFNVATSDTPQQVFTRDYHQKNLAFLLGIKAGNAGLATSYDLGRALWDARLNPEIPLLQRVPLGGVILTNMNLSFVAAKTVSIGLLCGYIAVNNTIPIDKAKPAWDAWTETNQLSLFAAIPFFLGADALMSRIPATRDAYRAIMNRYEIAQRTLNAWETVTNSIYALQLKAWADAATSNIQNSVQNKTAPLGALLDRLPFGLGNDVSGAFQFYAGGLLSLWRGFPRYIEEFVQHGAIGCNRLAGERNPEINPTIESFRTLLQSKPIELSLRDYFGPLAIDSIVKPVSAPFDRFLKFIGEVMPDRSGAFLGFWIDIGANSALDIAGTMIFNKQTSFGDLLLPGIVISTLVGFANTRISQHPDFTPSQALIHRTKLGIMKSAAFRGVWGGPATNKAIDLGIQVAYGLYAMWQAQKWTQPQSPIPVAVRKRIEAAKKRGDLSVAVLDSGLGGLAMFANMQRQLERGPFRSLKSTFHNVQTGPERGINDLPTMAARAAELDRQIRSAIGNNNHDLIILACHTLSLVFPHTEYAKLGNKAPVPVLDVNRVSTEMMVQGMRREPNAQMIVMSTPTVANSGYFQAQLQSRRIDPQRVINSPSTDLLISSQNDPSGAATSALVNRHVKNVLRDVRDIQAPILVALNCSQYALIAGLIQDAFSQHGVQTTILNPNVTMLRALFGDTPMTGHALSSQAYVYSQVPVPSALAETIATISQTAADAMRTWKRPPLPSPAHSPF